MSTESQSSLEHRIFDQNLLFSEPEVPEESDGGSDLRSPESPAPQPEQAQIGGGDVPIVPRRGDRHRPDRFRLRGKRFFLTYPQCPHLGGSIAAAQLCTELGSNRYLVCRELHADKTEHLHVFVEFSTVFATCDPTRFDLRSDGHTYHGNYQVVRSARSVSSYVLKDGDFDSVGFTPQEIRDLRKLAKERTYERIGERLLAGDRVETLVRANPGLLLKFDIARIQRQADAVRSFDDSLKDRICDKLDIFNYRFEFDVTKACRNGGNYHVWLCGEPGSGKSTIFRSSPLRFYYVDDVNNWAQYDDANFDAILFDDVTPTSLHKFGFAPLNRLLDGPPVRMNCKHGHAPVNKKMPIFFVSNWNILNCTFPGDMSFNAFLTRLNILECTRTPQGPMFANISVLNNPFKC